MKFILYFFVVFALTKIQAAPNPKFKKCFRKIQHDALPEKSNSIFEALSGDDGFKKDPGAFKSVAMQYACLNEEIKDKLDKLPIVKSQARLNLPSGEPSRLSVANEDVQGVLFDGDVVLTPDQFKQLVKDRDDQLHGLLLENHQDIEIEILHDDAEEKKGGDGKEEEQKADESNADQKNERRKRKVDGGTHLRWPLPIRYSFTDKMSTSGRRAVEQAIDFWQKNTCLRFQHDTTGGGNKISFTKSDGCWSYIGKQGGSQTLSIGAGCEYMDIAAHEIGHAMGFYHEQSRSDRDKYISINRGNIESNNVYNFEKMKNMNDYKGCYDYGSVMHYQANAFGKDQHKPTMISLNPLYQDTMGSWFISFTDVKQINDAYNCKDKCKSLPNLDCKRGGYQDPNDCSKCRCPYGFGGTLCDKLMESDPPSCGGKVLQAKQKWSKLNMASRASGDCYFHIEAPEGKTIEMRFSSLAASCEPGCSIDFVEIKTGVDTCGYNSPKPDFQSTGHRFCCLAPRETLYTVSNLAVMIVHVGKHVRMELQYKIRSEESGEEGEVDLKSGLISSCQKFGPWAEWSYCCGGCPQIRVRNCLSAGDCPCDEDDLQEEQDCCRDSLCNKCPTSAACCEGYINLWDRCLRESPTRTRSNRRKLPKCRK